MVLPMRISVAVTPGRSCARAMAGAARDAAEAASNCRLFTMVGRPLPLDLGAFDQAAEPAPGGAVPALQLHLLDGPVVLRAGAQGDSRQQDRHRDIAEIRGLAHHVLAREIAVALRQQLPQRAAEAVAVDDVA